MPSFMRRGRKITTNGVEKIIVQWRDQGEKGKDGKVRNFSSLRFNREQWEKRYWTS